MPVYFKKYVYYINTICETKAYFFVVRQTVSALNTVLSVFSILSDDRSKASSKTMPSYSAMQSLLLQMRISPPVLKVIQ